MNPSCAYAIGEVALHASPIWLSAHELGHLLSGLHDELRIADCPNGKILEGSGRFNTGTVMASTRSNVLHYSHPEVSWNDIPTGDDGKTIDEHRFNAKNMSNMACRVQNYSQQSLFSIQLIAPSEICYEMENPVMLEAKVNPPALGYSGQPPYNYKWTWNTSGIFSPNNLGTFIGNDQIESFDIPFGLEYVFVRLEVTASDGAVKFQTKKIKINYGNKKLCFPLKPTNHNILDHEVNTIDVSVYPNPISNQNLIEFFVGNNHSKVLIEVTDVYGKLKKVIYSGHLEKGNHQLEFDMLDSKAGLYFLAVSINKHRKTIKLIK